MRKRLNLKKPQNASTCRAERSATQALTSEKRGFQREIRSETRSQRNVTAALSLKHKGLVASGITQHEDVPRDSACLQRSERLGARKRERQRKTTYPQSD